MNVFQIQLTTCECHNLQQFKSKVDSSVHSRTEIAQVKNEELKGLLREIDVSAICTIDAVVKFNQKRLKHEQNDPDIVVTALSALKKLLDALQIIKTLKESNTLSPEKKNEILACMTLAKQNFHSDYVKNLVDEQYEKNGDMQALYAKKGDEIGSLW